MNQKLVTLIAIGVMLGIFAAYMIFLTYTWQQTIKDRSANIAKFDAAIDRAVGNAKQPDAE